MKKVRVGLLYLSLFFAATVWADLYKYTDEKGGAHFTDNPINIPKEQKIDVKIIETKNGNSDQTSGMQQKKINEFTRRETPLSPFVCIDDDSYSSNEEACYIKLCTIIMSNNDWSENRELRSSSVEYKKWKNSVQVAFGVNDRNVCSFVSQDPHFSTPETTWEFFRESLLNGKTDEAMSCFSFGSLKKHQELFTYLGGENLKKMAAEMQSIQKITLSDDSAKYRIRRKERGQDITYYIYFDNFAGNWKIRQF